MGFGISGYPEIIKIISSTGQVYSTPTDYKGIYKSKLPQGSYCIMPSKHYYWMDDKYIRLNDSISKISITLPSVKEFTVPSLKIDTMAVPNRIPNVGIAHDFTNKKAHLLDDFI